MSNFNFTVTTEVEESLAVEGGLCTAATPGLWEITDLLVKKERDLQVAYQHVAHLEQMNASLWGERSAAVRAEEVLKLCMPIVRDLFAETNSRTVYDQCKAAIAAYEELIHAPVIQESAANPASVVASAIRYPGDCQGERPRGMGGLQLPGQAERQENRTLLALFDGIPQSDGYTAAYVEWDDEKTATFIIGRRNDLVGSYAEALAQAEKLADDLRRVDIGVIWRRRPEITCEEDFQTGKQVWGFYCRYATVGHEDVENMRGITWKKSLL